MLDTRPEVESVSGRTPDHSLCYNLSCFVYLGERLDTT